MKNMKIFSVIAFFAALMLTQSSCIKEYTDPSSLSSSQVVSSTDGLVGLINGLQLRYTVGRQSPLYQTISSSGLVTAELRSFTVGNVDEGNLFSGLASVTRSNGAVAQLWAQSFQMQVEANLVLDNLAIVADPKTKALIQAYAHFYKAASYGTLATFFEKTPITVGKNQPFVSREEALRAAVTLLEGAESVLSVFSDDAAGNTEITSLSTNKFVAGFSLRNSIRAYQARFNLMLKDYGKALAAANKVVLTTKSAFRFDAVNVNPVFFVSYSNDLNIGPNNKTMTLPGALAPDTLDKRLPFYLMAAAATRVNLGASFFKTNTSEIPVYLPGEMTLIKAECLAQSDVGAAVTQLNAIIKKKAAEDAWGVGADFAAGYTGAATKDAVLLEVYRQRCIELFNLGLRLEDSRRFNRPGPDQPAATRERGRNFFPYPQAERDNNTSIPDDPTL